MAPHVKQWRQRGNTITAPSEKGRLFPEAVEYRTHCGLVCEHGDPRDLFLFRALLKTFELLARRLGSPTQVPEQDAVFAMLIYGALAVALAEAKAATALIVALPTASGRRATTPQISYS